jgi:EAL domain-containing protein (putative c-di-GMP-specific phosphodiesterase class I)
MNNWLSSLKQRFARDFGASPEESALVQHDRDNRARSIRPTLPDPEQVPPTRRGLSPKVSSGSIEGLFFVLGLLLFASLLLGVIAFTRPLRQQVPASLKYQQSGAFSYSASAPLGIYDTGMIVTGQPIFPKLTCRVKLTFKYSLLGENLQVAGGTHQLIAQVEDSQSGWQRSIILEQITPFNGNSFSSSVPLDVCQAEALASSMENETDLHPPIYSLIIKPQVKIAGIAGGKGFQDSFNPALNFQFDKIAVYLAPYDPTQVDPLNPTASGLVKYSQMVANTLPLFGLQPEILALRKAAGVGLGLSLAGLLALGLILFFNTRGSQAAYLQMKYSSVLVDVQGRALETNLPSVEVFSMDDLVKLAERNSTMILHEHQDGDHSYFVQGDRFIYRYRLYTRRAEPESTSPLQLEGEKLRLGFERGEFQVHYQPIVSLREGRIAAVEALLRWRRSEGEIASAAEFIRAAEETGWIQPLGEWMLKVALTQLKEWQQAGKRVNLAVNLSERQLVQGDTAQSILHLLEGMGMDPQLLQIEVPASSFQDNAPAVLASLRKLSDRGVQIAVDDFTGQSALDRLGSYPIQSIKIDRSSIVKINIPENASRISAIIREAHKAGLNVVAEGVETEEELNFLRTTLCPQAQGYLLGRPVPAEALTNLLLDELPQPCPKAPRRRRATKEKSR